MVAPSGFRSLQTKEDRAHVVNPFPNTPFWDHPKFKKATDDNRNVASNSLPNNSDF